MESMWNRMATKMYLHPNFVKMFPTEYIEIFAVIWTELAHAQVGLKLRF